MKTCPILLDMRGRLAVVVGGGAVALRKAASLAAAGARVRIVAPEVAGGAVPAGAAVLAERYRSGHLDGAALALACTDVPAVNARVAADARAAGVLVNVADDAAPGDFTMPAVAREGDVVVAVGTGSAAPHLARWLRDRLADALPERIGEFAAMLDSLREQLKADEPDARRRAAALRAASGEAAWRAFLDGGERAVRGLLADATETGTDREGPCPPPK